MELPVTLGAAVLLLLISYTPAQAQPGATDDVTRVAAYTTGCSGGDMQSCTNLGTMYRMGWGVAKDSSEAIASFTEACDGGNSEGCEFIAVMRRLGEVPAVMGRIAIVRKQWPQGSLQKHRAFEVGAAVNCDGYNQPLSACDNEIAALHPGDQVQVISSKEHTSGGFDIYKVTFMQWDGWVEADELYPAEPVAIQSSDLQKGTSSTTRVADVGSCTKTISFAVLSGTQAASTVPAFAQKWIGKNAKKFPTLCFSQAPNPHTANYVLVLSTSQSAFNGIYPTVHRSTNTDTMPVSGNGTVTDNYGGMWSYSYTGTATITTTTTSQVNLPYTDTTNALYINSYDQNGRLLSQHSRSVTSRQGGDGYNTLGYNLGSLLFAIGVKERLLKEAVNGLAAPTVH
jgi:hypothetical protein